MRLAICAWLTIAALRGQQQEAVPRFEVASIKVSSEPPGHWGVHTNPGYLRVQNSTVQQLIQSAYRVQDFQISGAPGWMTSDRFEIDARAPGPTKDEEFMAMLRTLLAERFHLVMRRETRPMSGYAMVPAKGGLKIKAKDDGTDPTKHTTHHEHNAFAAVNMSMESLARTVSEVLETPVADETGVAGVFDITLRWSSDEARVRPDGGEARLPSLPEAMQQELGLRLEARRVNMEVLVVERVERPTEN